MQLQTKKKKEKKEYCFTTKLGQKKKKKEYCYLQWSGKTLLLWRPCHIQCRPGWSQLQWEGGKRWRREEQEEKSSTIRSRYFLNEQTYSGAWISSRVVKKVSFINSKINGLVKFRIYCKCSNAMCKTIHIKFAMWWCTSKEVHLRFNQKYQKWWFGNFKEFWTFFGRYKYHLLNWVDFPVFALFELNNANRYTYPITGMELCNEIYRWNWSVLFFSLSLFLMSHTM